MGDTASLIHRSLTERALQLGVLLFSVALLATPAGAQDHTDEPSIDDVLRDFQANTEMWSGPSYLTGDGIGLRGETRMRASQNAPGVCEQDRFSISVGPDRGDGIRRATQVVSRTTYALMAIEPKRGDGTPEALHIAQDIACSQWGAGRAAYIDAEDADTAWLAGQIIEALAVDARTGQRVPWDCRNPDRCPTRGEGLAVLELGDLTHVRATRDDCPNDHECRVLVLGGDIHSSDLWTLTVALSGLDPLRVVSVAWGWAMRLSLPD
ncbi:hypothetical protein [Brevundimonas sp. A19_0]|uniref:hypothetical protein n=1 Tax=Brevundimonas sp. A19_0 TaxID=2821087 RepID=UPI001ADB72A9|nr:hypothetical protein [Brevundimonas sp. A19_0]MBO9500229.1 hypothetical protein [Brevundimonas sp. A19_0]